MEAGIPSEGSGQRWYQSSSFWLGPFMLILALVVGAVIGVGWYILGGFPRDHDAYATVPVPGLATVNLPEGDVRINFENDAHQSGDSTILEDQPEGLDVRVVPAEGGDELEIEDVPSWIFASTSGDRGHEPYAKIDVPEAGEYVVQAADEASGGFNAPPPQGAVADDAGPEIALGKSPWTPLDSRFLGAVLAGLAVVLIVLLFTLPFRFFIKRS
jgi:hypothetical protein